MSAESSESDRVSVTVSNGNGTDGSWMQGVSSPQQSLSNWLRGVSVSGQIFTCRLVASTSSIEKLPGGWYAPDEELTESSTWLSQCRELAITHLFSIALANPIQPSNLNAYRELFSLLSSTVLSSSLRSELLRDLTSLNNGSQNLPSPSDVVKSILDNLESQRNSLRTLQKSQNSQRLHQYDSLFQTLMNLIQKFSIHFSYMLEKWNNSLTSAATSAGTDADSSHGRFIEEALQKIQKRLEKKILTMELEPESVSPMSSPLNGPSSSSSSMPTQRTITEEIRQIMLSLSQTLFDGGQFHDAQEILSLSRDYSAGFLTHNVEVSFALIICGLRLQDIPMVNTNLSRLIENPTNVSPCLRNRRQLIHGLIALQNGDFHSTIQAFRMFDVDIEMSATTSSVSSAVLSDNASVFLHAQDNLKLNSLSSSSYSMMEDKKTTMATTGTTGASEDELIGLADLVSVQSIGFYHTVAALMVFPPMKLHEWLQNRDDKRFLSYFPCDPFVSSLVSSLSEGKYHILYENLSSLYVRLLGDPYLSSHTVSIINHLSETCMLNFVSPYQSIPLSEIASVLGQPLDVIRQQVLQSIRLKKLSPARLDPIDDVLLRSSACHPPFQQVVTQKIQQLVKVQSTFTQRVLLQSEKFISSLHPGSNRSEPSLDVLTLINYYHATPEQVKLYSDSSSFVNNNSLGGDNSMYMRLNQSSSHVYQVDTMEIHDEEGHDDHDIDA